jgi:hypothetical protein
MQNRHAATDGVESNHRAVQMELNLTSIKLKEKKSAFNGKNNWRKILEDEDCCQMYNKILLASIVLNISCEEFFKAATHTGQETAILIKKECEGCFVFSKDILMPAIN